jgi:hypothetical protein
MTTYVFDVDFAGPAEYARLYRNLGIQVIPSKLPSEDKAWKRPVLAWREYENALVPDETFIKWYGPQGQYNHRSNLGIITGTASDNIIVVDVDLQRHDSAQVWLMQMQEACNEGTAFRTPTQRTGGGGIQLLFRGRPDWKAPTCKTSLGVDIRGQGGFACLPPSVHESGKAYEWLPNLAPWQMQILSLPAALEAEIDRLALVESKGGSNGSTGGSERTASPQQALNPFGMMVDGREDYMTRLVWARMLDIHRDCPILPSMTELSVHIEECFKQFERKVKSRIVEPGQTNAALLEREGRGISLMISKFQHALNQWDSKVAEQASKPNPHKQIASRQPRNTGSSARIDMSTGEIVDEEFGVRQEVGVPYTLNAEDAFEVLYPPEIKLLPDPKYLIDSLIIDESLAFLYGPPGCGKSFIAIDIALCVATQQKQWFERQIHKSGPVIYISSEGTGDIKYRIMAWEQAKDVKTDEHPFALIRQPINFMDLQDIEKLIQTAEKVVAKFKLNPVLIVVDTVSRVLPGADENLQKDMTLFIRANDLLREKFKCTVMGVHHTNKLGDMRGSSVFNGAGDCLLEVRREEGAETGELHAKKIKSAPDGWSIQFKLNPVQTGDIKGTSSLVPSLTTAPIRQDSEWPDRTICQSILNAVEAAWEAKQPWSPYPQAKATGRYAASVIAHRWGLEEAQAARMLELWQANGILAYELCDAKQKVKGLKVMAGGRAAEKAEQQAEEAEQQW